MAQTFDIEAAKNFQKARIQKKKKLLDERFKRALKDFDQITEMIIRKYNPKKIYQWGSLIDSTKFSEISDIDIALEGINDAESFFNLVSDAEKLSDFPLDIIQLEETHTLHKTMIKKNGKLIYSQDES